MPKTSVKRRCSDVPKKRRGEKSTRKKPRQPATEEAAGCDEMETGEGDGEQEEPRDFESIVKMRTRMPQQK